MSQLCPAYQGTQPLGIFQYGFDTVTGSALLDVVNVYDAFTPLPGTRYVLWKAIFDHSFSESGAQDPSVACGFADTGLCLNIVSTETIDPFSNSTTFGMENESVTWSDPSNFQPCPGAVQAEATTWGRVKSLYR